AFMVTKATHSQALLNTPRTTARATTGPKKPPTLITIDPSIHPVRPAPRNTPSRSHAPADTTGSNITAHQRWAAPSATAGIPVMTPSTADLPTHHIREIRLARANEAT